MIVWILMWRWGETFITFATPRMEFVDIGQRLDSHANGLSVALGDLDSDGYIDAVSGNEADPVMVYLNDGNGHFMQKTQTQCGVCTMPFITKGIALGKLDQDDSLDVFLANKGDDFVWFNDHFSG